MKIGKWVRLLTIAAPFVAGCAGFWDAPGSSSSGGGCTTNCTTASSGNFYILNGGTTPEIVGEAIVSGKLTALSGSPWAVPSSPYAMAISPSGNLLFVSTLAGVYAYPISSGQLGTAIQVSTDSAALALQVDTTGTWLLEAIQASGGVTLGAVPINASTGAPTGSEISITFSISNASVQQNKMVISPDNAYIFAALGAGGTIVVPFNSAAPFPNGTSATHIGVANSSGSALAVAVDPSKRLFYIGETLANSTGTSGGLRAFLYSSLGGSSLTQASGSPIASGGLAPNFIQPSSGNYVYVANGQGTSSSGNVTSFLVSTSGSTYSLASGSTITAGVQTYGLAIDSTANFMLAVNNLGNPYFDAFTFDSSTAGELDAQIVANTGSGPIAIVAQ